MTEENRNNPDTTDADKNLLGDPDAIDAADEQAGAADQTDAAKADDAAAADVETDTQADEAQVADPDPAAPVDRRQLDGVMSDLRDERSKRQELERQVEDLRRAEEERQRKIAEASQRDYQAELAAVEEKWEEGQFEDFKTFQQERDAILVDQARDNTTQELRQRAEKEAQEADATAWKGAVADFLGDEVNAKYNDDPILSQALTAAVQTVFEKHQGKIDYPSALKEAKKEVESRFASVTPGSPADATRESRRIQQAEATASGAALPPPPTAGGGIGARGVDGGIDMDRVNRDNWEKVPEAQRNAALGAPED